MHDASARPLRRRRFRYLRGRVSAVVPVPATRFSLRSPRHRATHPARRCAALRCAGTHKIEAIISQRKGKQHDLRLDRDTLKARRPARRSPWPRGSHTGRSCPRPVGLGEFGL
jgi:hypothetical protein